MDDIILQIAGQGIAPAIVVAIYLTITKILDFKRDNKQIKINAELAQSINALYQFVNNITKNILDKDKEKAKAAVCHSIDRSAYNLTRFFVDTLVNNHIEENKDNVLSNIDNLVTSEYYNVFHTLSLYVINGNEVSSLLKKEWIDSIKEDMIALLYNKRLNKEDKILSFNHKLDIKFQSYITYILNNILK